MVPKNNTSRSHTPKPSLYDGPSSMSSISPSPPLNQHGLSHRPGYSFSQLPPLWGAQKSSRISQSYSPEPQDFTNYRLDNSTGSPNLSASYTEQNTLPPILDHNPQDISRHLPSILDVGYAIPLTKHKLDSPPEFPSEIPWSIGTRPNRGASPPELNDPFEGARVLLTLGSRESVIRKRAELMGEIDILEEEMERLKRSIDECNEFLGNT